MPTYCVVATGPTEADLVAENEHRTLRAARADAARLVASEHKPTRVEISSEEGANTHYVWNAPRVKAPRAKPARLTALQRRLLQRLAGPPGYEASDGADRTERALIARGFVRRWWSAVEGYRIAITAAGRSVLRGAP